LQFCYIPEQTLIDWRKILSYLEELVFLAGHR
jgi:hypothetical protein